MTPEESDKALVEQWPYGIPFNYPNWRIVGEAAYRGLEAQARIEALEKEIKILADESSWEYSHQTWRPSKSAHPIVTTPPETYTIWRCLMRFSHNKITPWQHFKALLGEEG